MLSRLFLASCLLLAAKADVNYGDSVLYDEFDLSAQKMIEMHKCLTGSCKIYVAAPASSLPSLDNINIGDTTLGEIARDVDENTGVKTPYLMKAYSNKAFIKNLNSNHTCAPVAVLIVYERAAFFSTALVVDPVSSPLSVEWRNASTLTVFSATPFSVRGTVKSGNLTGKVFASGFDLVEKNKVRSPSLYEFPTRKTFEISVNGPLATLYSTSEADVELTIENSFEVIASSPTFLATPGYTGVQNGHVYRSSLYPSLLAYHLAYDRETSIHIEAFLNTLNDNVAITVDGKDQIKIHGARGRRGFYQKMDIVGKEIDISFEKSKDKSAFLLKFYTDDVEGMKVDFIILSAFITLATALDGRVDLLNNREKQKFVSQLIATDEAQFTEIAENSFTLDHLLSVLSASQLIVASNDCKEDLGLLVNAWNNPKANTDFVRHVLAKMIDSSGKKSPAILRGHFHFAGHFSECVQIDYKVDGRDRNFQGAYFRTNLDPFFRPNSGNGSCMVNLQSGKELDIFWRVGFCLPASCSSAELMNVFRPESGSIVDNPVCQLTRPGDITPEINAGFYITLSIIGVIVAICIVSGLVEFYFCEMLSKTAFSKSLGWQLFMSFSLYSNISGIFDVSDSAKAGQISPINCIRFFSMVWVLLSHLTINYVNVVANPIDVYVLARDITTEAVLNAYFSVDSFFFISGVLLTFVWFKIHARQPKETMSLYGWMMFYVHRILRISPAFYMIVIFYTFVLKQLMRETPLSMESSVTTDSCGTTWWLELLYAHNWVHDDCVGYSWYLATDMQIYLFTPLIIIPLAIKPILGLIVAAAFFIISTATNIFLVYHFHWPAEDNWFHPKDPEETNMTNYIILMYDSPIIRCQIYIMGMLVGWFLQTKKQMKIHPIIYLSSWVIGLALMLTVLLGLHDQTNGTVLSLFWRAMYSAFSRPAWGIGLSVIVVMCYYGYGGPINTFMSWHIWVPLGRLSYCAYLVHIPVIQLVLSLSTDEVYFSNFTEFFITRVVAVTAVTFFVATFWSACFELSFGRIEKLLLGGVRTKAKSTEKIEQLRKELPVSVKL